jgi:hypothetical protein
LVDTFTEVITSKINIEFDIGIMAPFGFIFGWLMIWWSIHITENFPAYNPSAPMPGILWYIYHTLFVVVSLMCVGSLWYTASKKEVFEITEGFNLDNLIFIMTCIMMTFILLASAYGMTFTLA